MAAAIQIDSSLSTRVQETALPVVSLATVTAVLETPENRQARGSHLFHLTRQEDPSVSGNEMSVNVLEALLKMVALLSNLESTIVQENNQQMLAQGQMSTATTLISHKIAVKQEQEIQKAKEEYEKAEKLSGILKVFGGIATALSVVFAGMCGPGALIVTSAIIAMQQSGVLDKLFGDCPAWSRLLISAGIGILAGGVAAGIDAGVARAMSAGTEAAASSASSSASRSVAEEAAPSIADKAKASFRFSGLMVGSEMLMQLHPIQDLLTSALGKDSKLAMALSMIITILVTVACTYYAGAGVANTQSPQMARLFSAVGSFQALTTAGQGVFQIVKGFNLRDMADTEKKRSETDPAMEILKSVNQMIDSLQQQFGSVNRQQIKGFESDFQNLAAISRPWEAAARALSGAA